MKIYHVSKIPNLTILEPRISTHGKPWIYATRNLTTALVFGAPKDDFDFILGVNKSGQTELYETYPKFLKLYIKAKNVLFMNLKIVVFVKKRLHGKRN